MKEAICKFSSVGEPMQTDLSRESISDFESKLENENTQMNKKLKKRIERIEKMIKDAEIKEAGE